MLYKVEQTSAAVLDMFPDLELAVDEGVPQLAHEFFSVVKRVGHGVAHNGKQYTKGKPGEHDPDPDHSGE